MTIQPVILSGGSGSRLWPLSRSAHPKQFLSLAGDHSMLQDTWRRVAAIAGNGPIVVSNEDHRFMVAEQLRQAGAGDATLLLEPTGRNTAPAIAVAALEAVSAGGDPLLLVLPSDHVIRDEATFRATVWAAVPAAEAGKLVMFGIVPTGPETGYGYIRGGEAVGGPALAVDGFVEKPDRATAESYVASGKYYWNSGMFLFRASRYLEELGRLRPEMLSACRDALAASTRDNDFTRLEAEAFSRSPSDSIDYAVMEHTSDAVVVPLSAGWSDVGSWAALWEVAGRDADGNAHRGDVLALGCSNTLAWGDGRLVALLGLEDVVVVDTADAVLVARKDRVQEVKGLVDALKAADRPETTWNRKVYRPWGAYDSIDMGERFQVKRITVNPGGVLSLQMHHHRAEHWVVVSGTARVTRGEETFLLGENESTYIPIGVKHRLENPGELPLELIEVQSGSYLGEDDIVRFEDAYGRTSAIRG